MTAIALQRGLLVSDSALVNTHVNPLHTGIHISDATIKLVDFDIRKRVASLVTDSNKPKFCFPKYLYHNNKRVTGIAVTGDMTFIDKVMSLKRKKTVRQFFNDNLDLGGLGVIYFVEGNNNPIQARNHVDITSSLDFSNIKKPPCFDDLYPKPLKDESDFEALGALANTWGTTVLTELKLQVADEGAMLYYTNSSLIRDNHAVIGLMSRISEWYREHSPIDDEDFFGPKQLVKLASNTEVTINGKLFYGTREEDVVSEPFNEDRFEILTRFHAVKLISQLHLRQTARHSIRVLNEFKKHSFQASVVLEEYLKRRGFFEPI